MIKRVPEPILGDAATAPPIKRGQWKKRCSESGVHFFDRMTGLNILFDEASVPKSLYARAPRQLSIALTYRCDLACAHCYAPKSPDQLRYKDVAGWLTEVDLHGTLGVGFGGGEPTLHSDFVKLCQYAERHTQLSVSFTTHGHHIDGDLADRLRGSVHFIRVSMDGVGSTYEAIRGRPFPKLLAHLSHVQSISRFGVNVVINERTLPDLDQAATVAADAGACEMLLLPQIPVRSVSAIETHTLLGLRRWVQSYKGPLKLCINASCAEGFSTCDPLASECGVRAYAHIDATGTLKPSSYHSTGVPIGEFGVLQALDKLTNDSAEKA